MSILPRSFVALEGITIAASFAWGLYLIVLPLAQFVTSPVWVGVLAVTPGHSPRTLGWSFCVLAVLLGAGLFHRLRAVGWIANALAIPAWLALAAQFGYAAIQNEGLGGGNAVLNAWACGVHVVLLYARREHHG